MKSGNKLYWKIAVTAGTLTALSACAQVEVRPEVAEPPQNEPAVVSNSPVITTADGTPEAEPIIIDTPKAPEVLQPDPSRFRAEGMTVWEGGPSLGGDWIAHPLIDGSMKGLVTNLENGKSFETSLLNRGASRPGPQILISGDAARKLGMEPGVPTRLRIVALSPVSEEEAQRILASTNGGNVEAIPVAEPVSTGAAISKEAAAEQADPFSQTVATSIAPSTADDDEGQDTDTVAAEAAANDTTTLTTSPSEEPDETAEPATVADNATPIEVVGEAPLHSDRPLANSSVLTSDNIATTRRVEASEPVTASAASAASVASTTTEDEPAPAIAPETSSLPQSSDRTASGADNPNEPTEEAVASAPEPEQKPENNSTLQQSFFVQAATFGNAKNAARTRRNFTQQGLPVKSIRTNNGKFTRILVGPFSEQSKADEALAAVRAAGFEDAMFVTR